MAAMPALTSLLHASLALLAVLALLLLAALLARRLGLAGAWVGEKGRSPGRRLVLEESLALDPRRRLLLLRCDGQPLLLLTSGGQDILLSQPVTLAPGRGEAISAEQA